MVLRPPACDHLFRHAESSDTCCQKGVCKTKFLNENYPNMSVIPFKLNESYSEVLEFGEKLWAAYGEEATVEVVLPFHNFYDGIFMMYLKDESPILFDDGKCSIIRAPYMGN